MNSAGKLNISLEDQAALEIARRARGTPRVANRLLRRVRDYAQVKTDDGKINKDTVDLALRTLGIDEIGLDENDRKLLRIIDEHYKGGPVGIEALAATLNEEVDTIVDVIEPYLLKMGFLRRTPRGRELTELSLRHIKGRSSPKRELQQELY